MPSTRIKNSQSKKEDSTKESKWIWLFVLSEKVGLLKTPGRRKREKKQPFFSVFMPNFINFSLREIALENQNCCSS